MALDILFYFMDDHSDRMTVYTILFKFQCVDCYLKWEKLGKRPTERKIRVPRSGRGGKYLSGRRTTYFDNLGIRHELKTRYSPLQNGVAQPLNIMLIEFVLVMLNAKKLPKRF